MGPLGWGMEFVEGLVTGDADRETAREDQMFKDGREALEPTGLTEMWEGIKDIPLIGDVVSKGPGIANHLGTGFNQLGSFVSDLF